MTANASGDPIMRPQRTQDDAKGNQRDTRQDPTVFMGTEESSTNGIARVKPYESEYDAGNQGSGHDIGRREDNVKIKAHQILHNQHPALMPRQPIHQILQQVGYYKRTYKTGQQQEPIAIAHQIFLKIRGWQHQQSLVVVLALHAIEHHRGSQHQNGDGRA